MRTGKTFKSSYWERWLVTLIILMALFFRLYRLEELMVFSGETNNLLYYIESYLSGEKPILLGLEAAQYVHHLFHLPWYLWMMIPIFLAGGGNPVVLAVFQAAAGALGVFLLWRIGLLAGEKRIGLAAAFIDAVWLPVVTVEKFVSPVSWVPFGVIVTIYLVFLASRRKSRFWFLGLGFWAGAVVSFHWALLSAAALVLIWTGLKQQKFLGWTAVGIAAAFLPMAIFDLRHGFFNLTGLWYVGKSLFDSTRPYGSSHFIYQFYPLLILAAAWLTSVLPRRIGYLAAVIFLTSQFGGLVSQEIHPNLADRRKVVIQIIDSWGDKMEVYFKKESSFDYGYLLRWEARQRGLDWKRIKIYEPWQPENNASLVVEGNGTLVYLRE